MCSVPESAAPSPSKLFPTREPAQRISTGKTWPVESRGTNRPEGQSAKIDQLMGDVHAEMGQGKM